MDTPEGYFAVVSAAGTLSTGKGLSLVTAQEKVRRLIESSTMRSIAKCIALCTFTQITGGRGRIKADKGKSCCS